MSLEMDPLATLMKRIESMTFSLRPIIPEENAKKVTQVPGAGRFDGPEWNVTNLPALARHCMRCVPELKLFGEEAKVTSEKLAQDAGTFSERIFGKKFPEFDR